MRKGDVQGIFVWLVLLLVLILPARGAIAQKNFEELQAAYLYNFGKYIKWPQESDNFIIGIYGESGLSFRMALERALKEKKISGKEIVIKNITSIEEGMQCNILYFPRGENNSVSAVSTGLRGLSVLIVTEEDVIRRGAMISFVVEDDRLKFKLKKDALLHSGLVASDGLLKLAIQL